MSKRDYYEVLGVSRDADDPTLKKAYRRLAMKHHPDRNQDSTESEVKFKEAKEAYNVLGDAQKRAAYNQFGHEGVNHAAGMGAGESGFGDIFGDMFGDILGGASGGRRRNRGSDLRFALSLTLEEAVMGVERKIRVPKMTNCATCDGSGSKPGSQAKSCGTCHGQGQVRMQQGFFSVQQTCPQCSGKGEVIANPCSSCSGRGVVHEEKTLSVKIPAGVDEGDQVRLSGEGESAGQGTSPGDLYVQMRLKKHDIFDRDGDNLYCEESVSYVTLALGGELEIPTLSGRASLKIPSETQSERVFRLRGKGIRNVRNGNQGDLYCKVVVEIPVKLTREQKNQLKSFEKSLLQDGNRHSPKKR